MEFWSTEQSPWPKGRWPAPDGGWGWMVVLGSGLVFMVTIGPIGSFGLIFGTFLENIEAETSDVTFINGLFFALGLLPGVLANRILHLFTCRRVTIFGGIFYFFGCLLSAFSNSVVFLVVTIGIIQGTGFGLLLPAAFTCLNHYFFRRRTLAMGVAQLMAAVGVMLYPLLIEVLLENYGFRGTQAILAALSLHTIVGAITMKPLDSSELMMTRKTWEKSIENTLRRKSIISLKSLKIKLDDDDDIILKTILQNRDERPHLNANSVTKADTVMEAENEDAICETKFLLDNHEQSSVQHSILNVMKNKTLDAERLAVTGSNLRNVPARSDMDIIMSGKEDGHSSNVYKNSKELEYLASYRFCKNKTRLLEKLKDDIYSTNSDKKRRKSLEFVKKERQSQRKQLTKQSPDFDETNSKINSSLPNILVNNSELNFMKDKPVRNETGDENDRKSDTNSDFESKLITKPKQMRKKCRKSETDPVFLGKSREDSQRTVLNNDITLEVPEIDILPASDSEKESSMECIKRSQSERSLTKNNQVESHEQNLTAISNSFRDVNVYDNPDGNDLHHTYSMTAFTKDFPNYHKPFNRSPSSDRRRHIFFSQCFDDSTPYDSLQYIDTKLIQSNSANNLPCIYNEKDTESDRIKVNSPTHDKSRKQHSHVHEKEDLPQMNPCFYEDKAPSHPTADNDTQNATTSLQNQNSKTHMSSSFEFLPRFPSSARTVPSNNRLPVVKITKVHSSNDNIEDEGSESLSFGISEDSEPRPPVTRSRRQSVMSWTADCMDLGLMKDVIFVNIVIGASFVLFSDNMFFNLQPLYYLSLGLQRSDIAVCIAINSAADLLGRVGFVISSSWLTYKSRLAFLLSSVATALFRIGFLVVYDFRMICLMTAFLGFFRSWISVCIPLIFAEYSTVDRFPAAYGLHLLTAGFVHLLIGPFVGLIRDVSGSYPTCLGAITGCLLFCIVPWIAEALLFRRSTVLNISS